MCFFVNQMAPLLLLVYNVSGELWIAGIGINCVLKNEILILH